jgi:membrane fusion protein, multidrug efflux system
MATETQVELEPVKSPQAKPRLSGPPPAVKRISNQRRSKLRLIGAAALVFGVIIGLVFFAHSQSYESTDDAFIDVHSVNISSKVAGRVARVVVTDNQEVKKGDVLVELDPRDFDAQVNEQKAALNSAVAQLDAARAGLEQGLAHVLTLQATVESDQAAAEAARAQADLGAKDLKRSEDLYNQKVISSQDLDNARASAKATQETMNSDLKKVVSDQAQVNEAKAQVGEITALVQSQQAKIDQSTASLDTATLNQSYSKVYAPEDGRVTRKSVAAGDYVQAGQSMFALVPDDVWITANFKENQIGLMRPGQPVEIDVDALPGHEFEGRVDSIQAGSGAAFSLLPPENATGNYVKVVQRVPVKLVFNQQPDAGLPLGPGESVVPTVKVQDFHYSPLALAVALAIVTGLALLILFAPARKPRKAS